MLKKDYKIDKKFIRNFSKLILGTGSAQLVNILTVPILTRLYGVEAYGIQAIYISIAGIVCIIATGRYESAILLASNDKKGFCICCLTLFLSVCLSICWELIYVLYADEVLYLLGTDNITYWLQHLPLTVISFALASVVAMWLNRVRDYNMMARSGVFISLVNFILAFVYAKLYPGDEMGLCFSTFTGQFTISMIFILYCYRKKYFKWSWISVKGMINCACRYQDMPKYMVVGGVFNELSSRLPIFFLQCYFGEIVVGWYSMSVKLLGMPLSLISSSIGNVFIRDAAEEWNNYGNCWNSFKKTILILIAIGVLPAIMIYGFATDVFVIFLGERWYMAGIYCIYLIPMYFIKFVFSPLSNVLFIAGKQKVFLFLQFCRAGVAYVSMWLGYSIFQTADAAIVLFGIGFSAYYITVLMQCGKIAKCSI